MGHDLFSGSWIPHNMLRGHARVETPLVDAQTMASVSAASEMPAEFAFDFSDLSTNYMPTMEQATADQQQTFDQMPMPMHFHDGISHAFSDSTQT
jgi:hypothetical protein